MKQKPLRILSAAAAGILATIVALCLPHSALDSALFDLTIRASAAKSDGRPGVAYIELDPPPGGRLDAKALAEGFELLGDFGASALVLDLSELPEIDSGAEERKVASLPPLFESEFGRIIENIRSLFEAIRLGSLRPKDSPRFVDELVGMVGQSGSLLLSAALAEDREDEAHLAEAIDRFGALYVVRASGDASASETLPKLRSMIEEKALERGPSLLFPDFDGVWRRGGLGDDIVLAAASKVGGTSAWIGEALPPRLEYVIEGEDQAEVSTIPLDESGNLLIDWGLRTESLPRLGWGDLNACARLEKELDEALSRMDAAGYLDEEAEARTEEGEAREMEIIERATYRAGAIQEARIVGEYDRVLASGFLSPVESTAVAEKRDEARSAFSHARSLLYELLESRHALETLLRGRLCLAAVAGSVARSPLGEDLSRGQARAVLAQTLLSAFSAEIPIRAVLPRGWAALSGFGLALAAAIALAFLSPGGALLLGLVLGLLAALGSSLGFAISLRWLEPSAAIASVAAAAIASAQAQAIAARADRRRREKAYAGRLPPAAYAVDPSGSPEACPDEAAFTGEMIATAMVVRATGAHEAPPAERLERLSEFHAAVRDIAFASGGILVAAAGDSASFCFTDAYSSPDAHAAAACGAALAIARNAPLGAAVGLDTGLCLIGPSGPPGAVAVSASGEALDMAFSAAGLNARCGTRVLATEEVVKAAGGVTDTQAKPLLRFRLAASGRNAMLYAMSGADLAGGSG